MVHALVLSKLHVPWRRNLSFTTWVYLEKSLQRVQKAAASFVLSKFARTDDVLSLNWLPVKEQREWSILKICYKVLHDANWPNYLKLQVVEHSRVLRSIVYSSQIQVSLIKSTFITGPVTAHLFDDLPVEIRNCRY